LRERRPVEVRVRWKATKRSLMSSVSMSPVIAVVAGGTSVFHDSAVVGSKPEKTEDSRIHVWVGGSEVMDGEMRLVHFLYFRKMKEGGGRVSDGKEGSGVKSGFGDQIVMWRGRALGSAERACIDNCPLEFSS
jgi:hypothetical protein